MALLVGETVVAGVSLGVGTGIEVTVGVGGGVFTGVPVGSGISEGVAVGEDVAVGGGVGVEPLGDVHDNDMTATTRIIASLLVTAYPLTATYR